MRNQGISLETALRLMREGAYLMMMHKSGEGQGYFIIRKGGGEVMPWHAKKIMDRPDVFPHGDGLFPGISQSWKMGTL